MMMRESRTKRLATQPDKTEIWTSLLQRRVMRLLLVLDPELFHGQFRTFYTGSSLASHPLLQFYDQHIKLLTLSEEFLDDILPRIHLQWSQITEHTLTLEEDPTRGQINWQRTIERASNETPGQLPLRFATRLRQQHSALPENLLTVVILLQHRQLVHTILRLDQLKEILINQERELLVNIENHLARELAKPQVRSLIEEAQKVSIDALVEQVKSSLHPGPSPYRDLLDWWELFSELRIGSTETVPRLSLTYSHTHNAQMDLWLYELWLALELIFLLQERHALVPDTLTLAMDQLSFTFAWNDKRYRFRYQRRGMTETTATHHWEQIPAIQSSYLVERESPPLIVEYKGKRIWQEPPVVVDVVYTADTGEVMQQLLGNMTIYATSTALLISPYLADPQQGTQTSGVARYEQEQYNHRLQEMRIEFYKITPDMPAALLQECLLAILQHIVTSLPERPQPICCGVVLDQDSSNASGSLIQGYNVICPKPHIGPGVFDLVNVETDCLKNPRLCHVMDPAIVPPFVLRVVTQEELEHQCQMWRTRSNELLKAAEQIGDDIRAERIREQIFTGIGQAVEQYVSLFGNTTHIEETFREWVFGRYWQVDARSLSETTRRSLLSGEHIWENYRTANVLQDWAAPAIQYCRTLEFELKRRLYAPIEHAYAFGPTGFTLGKITHAYTHRSMSASDRATWNTMLSRIAPEQRDEFEHIVQRMSQENVHGKRNQLAHGEAISKEVAASLRDIVIGRINQPGILRWLAEHVAPA